MFVTKIAKFFNENPDSLDVFQEILSKTLHSFNGEELVHHMNRMIEYVFDIIEKEISPSSLPDSVLLYYMNELSVFARHNSQFLKSAAAHSWTLYQN